LLALEVDPTILYTMLSLQTKSSLCA